MRIASMCAISALALGFAYSPALAEVPPPSPPNISQMEQARNTFIFNFDESVDRGEMHARAREIVSDAGGTLRHVYTNVVGGFAATVPSIAVWSIGARRDIVAYQRDEIVTIAAPPKWLTGGGVDCTSKSEQEPWGVGRIGAPVAGKEGLGIHVYVIDTGIDLNHPDLADNMIPGENWTCIGGCVGGGDDDQGHGTHVAGTVGALDNDFDVVGVAPKVTLHSVKVLGSDGSGYRSDVIAGVNLVAGQAIGKDVPVVANLSLGGSGSKSGSCANGTGSDSYHQAFCEGADAGVVFVVAAGNDGGDAEKLVPAAYDDAVITVSATHNQDDWPKWSNWGDNAASWGPHSAPVTIAAPGVDIPSTQMCGGTTTKSGTSMASPHVAGVAAILIADGKYDTTNYATSTDRDHVFTSIRQAIVDTAAGSFETSLKGNKPHDEKFVCAEGACPPVTQ